MVLKLLQARKTMLFQNVIYLLYGLNTRYVIHCNSEESQVWIVDR